MTGTIIGVLILVVALIVGPFATLRAVSYYRERRRGDAAPPTPPAAAPPPKRPIDDDEHQA